LSKPVGKTVIFNWNLHSLGRIDYEDVSAHDDSKFRAAQLFDTIKNDIPK
jgi:hypothetical protein